MAKHIHIYLHDGTWTESKHPRAGDGKFGSGSGNAAHKEKFATTPGGHGSPYSHAFKPNPGKSKIDNLRAAEHHHARMSNEARAKKSGREYSHHQEQLKAVRAKIAAHEDNAASKPQAAAAPFKYQPHIAVEKQFKIGEKVRSMHSNEWHEVVGFQGVGPAAVLKLKSGGFMSAARARKSGTAEPVPPSPTVARSYGKGDDEHPTHRGNPVHLD